MWNKGTLFSMEMSPPKKGLNKAPPKMLTYIWHRISMESHTTRVWSNIPCHIFSKINRSYPSMQELQYNTVVAVLWSCRCLHSG